MLESDPYQGRHIPLPGGVGKERKTMKVVEELIRNEADGSLSFGNFGLDVKSKVSDFDHDGDLYKVKTFNEITKLEKNETFVYESVPGSAVFNYSVSEKEIVFDVTAGADVQITLELELAKEYDVEVDGVCLGKMATNLGGKLVFSVQAKENELTKVRIIEAK